MPAAPKPYPKIISPHRWCDNGDVPDVGLVQQLVDAQNHVMAYRRKVFMSWSDLELPMVGVSGTTERFNLRVHTGHGATRIRLRAALVREDSHSTLPQITMVVTTTGGGAVGTATAIGPPFDATGGLTGPDGLIWVNGYVDVDPNTTYHITINTIDFATIASIAVFEGADETVDASTDYFIELQPGAGEPVLDTTIGRLCEGLSGLWRKNGSHLLTFQARNESAVAPTRSSATWANLIDGSTAAVGATTPGIYLGDNATLLMEPWCRLSDGSVMDVVLAVHGSCTGAASGEFRLQNAGGTVASLTGIGTAAGWYTTTTTIDVAAIDKLDPQFRSNGINTFTLNAVCMYALA